MTIKTINCIFLFTIIVILFSISIIVLEIKNENSYIALAEAFRNNTIKVNESFNDSATAIITTASNNNNNNNFSIYYNPTFGITILYPSNWLETEHFIRGLFLTQFLSPPQNSSDKFPESVSISVTNLPANLTNDNKTNDVLELITNKSYESLKEFSRGSFNVIHSNDSTTVMDAPAYERVFTMKQALLDNGLKVIPLDLKIMQIYTVIANQVYILTYTAETSQFSRYLPIAQSMLDSFRLEPTRTNVSSINNEIAEFHSVFSTYIKPGTAQGHSVYSERPSNVPFKSGETAELYIELSGFGYKPEIVSNKTGDTIYTNNLTANILIFDKQGKQLMATKYQVPKTTILNNKVDQKYITVPTQIPQNIPSGDYEVRYFIIDNISGKNFEINKNIRIAPQIQAFVD